MSFSLFSRKIKLGIPSLGWTLPFWTLRLLCESNLSSWLLRNFYSCLSTVYLVSESNYHSNEEITREEECFLSWMYLASPLEKSLAGSVLVLLYWIFRVAIVKNINIIHHSSNLHLPITPCLNSFCLFLLQMNLFLHHKTCLLTLPLKMLGICFPSSSRTYLFYLE